MHCQVREDDLVWLPEEIGVHAVITAIIISRKQTLEEGSDYQKAMSLKEGLLTTITENRSAKTRVRKNLSRSFRQRTPTGKEYNTHLSLSTETLGDHLQKNDSLGKSIKTL